MPRFLPYKINHIHLDKPALLFFNPQQNYGLYYVYWWEQIPIGQLFIEPGAVLTEKEYFKLVWEAISPTIAFYQKSAVPDIEAYQRLFLDKDYRSFKIALEPIFAPYVVPTVPVADITIVICTRNRATYLRDCLVSLQNLVPKAREIIVVDNAPVDESTKRALSDFPDVVYLLEPRGGLDIARNSGIRRATSTVVAFMDDDIKAEPNCLAEIQKTFKDNKVAAMTGLVLAANLETEAQFLFEKEWTFNRGFTDKIYDKDYFNKTLSSGPPVWEIGAGANMAFRTAIFQHTGYFDERLDAGAAGCNGDSEMWFRILSNGFSIAYNPRAIVYHDHRRDLPGLRRQLFNYMRGFTVAALIQQQQQEQAGYYRQLFKILPAWYFRLVVKGFPHYDSRYSTIFPEIKGILAGLLYFIRRRKSPKINTK